MSAPTLSDIVDALRDTYTEDGIAIWLGATSSRWDGETAIYLCRTADGREKVMRVAESLTGQIAT